MNKYASKAQQIKMHLLMEEGKISPKVIAKLDKAAEGKNLPKRAHNRTKPINVRTIRHSHKRHAKN